MKKGLSELRQWLLAGGVMTLVLGTGIGVWQWATNFRVSSQTTQGATPAGQSNTNNVPAAVDPGATLTGKLAPDFQLINQFGQQGKLSDFRGKVVILSFIDSKCTTVCPLTAVVMQNVRYDLGSAAEKVQFVAVDANPTATTVADVYNWSKQHNVLHLWDFFTGTPAQLKSVYQNYYVQTTVLKGTNIEHTPAVYVIGPNGHERWLYLNADQATAPVIGAEVHNILKQVVPLIPGHPSVTVPPTRELAFLPGKFGPSAAKNRSFQLPAILPNGNMGTVQVGHNLAPKLLEFFATWCPDCEEEMPTLAKFEEWSKKHPGLPNVVGVDLSLSEPSTEHVKAYAKKLNLPFPIALDDKDKVANLYQVNGIPTQVLVSSTGHILWYHQGLIGLTDLEAQIKKNLKAQN